MSFSIAGEPDFNLVWSDIGSSEEMLMHYVSEG